MQFRTKIILAFAASLALLPAVAWSQTSAAEVLNTAAAQHEARMLDIEDYTLVQETMGVETVIHFEREAVDGRTVFHPRTVTAAGQSVPFQGETGWGEPYAAFTDFASRARLAGTEPVDGHRTHVVVVDDVAGMPGMAAAPGGQDDFEFEQLTLYVDATDHVLRRMVMQGTAGPAGQRQPVTVEARMEDYREIDGMLHPFRTVMVTRGMAAGVSAEELEEARRGLAELEAQMEAMPAAQREMMERMVRPQMEQFERMAGGEDMEVTTQVRELRVNTGPPADR